MFGRSLYPTHSPVSCRAGWFPVRSRLYPAHSPVCCRGSANFGVPKGGVPSFASKDFVKFVKDAGFWRDKGNQFNIKPPNRVDFVFTCGRRRLELRAR